MKVQMGLFVPDCCRWISGTVYWYLCS